MKTTNKFLLLLLLMVARFNTHAAETQWTDSFYRDGKYKVVVAILAIIFTGIIAYLVRIERKISRLEKKQKS